MVSARGGVCPGEGGVCPGGVCSGGVVSAHWKGGGLPRGVCIPAYTEVDTPPGQNS